MKTKILAIYGSPRRNGNTDQLMEEMLAGISRDGGVEISRVYVSEMNIQPCNGCSKCENTGVCDLVDDMQDIYPLLEESKIIIVSSPVYFYGLTSQLKALIDRTHVFWARKFILKRPWSIDDEIFRQGYLLCAAGTELPELFVAPELIIKYFFNCMDVVYTGMIGVTNIQDFGAIKTKPQALKTAYNRGVELVNPF